MINIDNILLEWSYRCKDGAVDLEDPEKITILQEVLKENNIKLIEEVVSINEAAADIKQQLIDAGYDVIIVDNLSTGSKKLIHPKSIFFKNDLLELDKLKKKNQK